MVSERIKRIWEISSDYDTFLKYIKEEKVSYIPDEEKRPIYRHAEAFAAVMDQMSCNYIPGSLIAGNGGDKFISRPEHLLQNEYDTIAAYPERCSENLLDALREEIFYIWPFSDGHIAPDFERLLKIGVNGLISELDKRLEDEKLSQKQRDFLICAKSEWEAVVRLEMRYADFFQNKANKAETLEEKDEYQTIADTVRKVPAEPATGFREALQSVYFLHMCTQFDDVSNHSFGRFDQYMYPYYRYSLENGLMTEKEAEELFQEFWLKYTPGYLKSRKEGTRSEGQGFLKENIPENGLTWLTLKCISHVKHVDDGQTMDICGLTENGEDGTNAISWLVIRTMAAFRTFEPKPVVKYTEKLDKGFLQECYKLLASGHGHPAISFQRNGIKALSKYNGYFSEEDKRNYCHIGCVELGVAGRAYTDPMNCFLNLPKIVNITMNGGKLNGNGKLIGLEQKGADSFADFLNNYYEQIDFFLDMYASATNEANPFYAQYFFRPLISSVIDGCIEKAVLVDEGGSKYWTKCCNCSGLATAGDAVLAIKKIVYERRQKTMNEFCKILDSNYFGEELFRKELLSLPKYGNGDKEADSITAEIMQHYCSHVCVMKTYVGTYYRPGMYSFYETVNRMGRITGATASGRRSGERFSLNTAPEHGMIKNGLTAALSSITSFEHSLADNACTVDLQLSSGVKPEVIGSVVEYLAKKDVLYLQMTVASTEDMYAAEKKPDDYQDLTVRVTGFSAQYISLDDQTRSEIRERSSWE